MPAAPSAPCGLLCSIDHWATVHEGLGGWTGAAFSVSAIFAAWLLARNEYRRDARRRRLDAQHQLATFRSVIEEFEDFVEPFIAEVKLGKFVLTFGIDTMNDPCRHMMMDIAHIPVLIWPSLPAYSAFKSFWFSQCELERLAALPGVSPDIIQKLLSNRETGLQALRQLLRET